MLASFLKLASGQKAEVQSLPFLSGPSCVSSYQGDLMNWNIAHHPTMSDCVSFPKENIGFHTNNLNKRKAHT